MKRASIASLAFWMMIIVAVATAQNSTPETLHKTPAASSEKTTSDKTVEPKNIAEKTTGMQKLPGFFTCYWDARDGKLWLQIDKWNSPFLYYESLPNGVGSNDVGLDRGQPGKINVLLWFVRVTFSDPALSRRRHRRYIRKRLALREVSNGYSLPERST